MGSFCGGATYNCVHAVTFAVVVDTKGLALRACGARSPDLTIPESFLLRADEIIE
jgi:hypothetical protein